MFGCPGKLQLLVGRTPEQHTVSGTVIVRDRSLLKIENPVVRIGVRSNKAVPEEIAQSLATRHNLSSVLIVRFLATGERTVVD